MSVDHQTGSRQLQAVSRSVLRDYFISHCQRRLTRSFEQWDMYQIKINGDWNRTSSQHRMFWTADTRYLLWCYISFCVFPDRYYISKGSTVDQLGGDLNSTPLHWAIRWLDDYKGICANRSSDLIKSIIYTPFICQKKSWNIYICFKYLH